MITIRDIKNSADLDNFIEMESEKLHLIKIGAPWCGPCRNLGNILHNLDETRIGDTLVADVNIDEDGNDDIATRYNVRSIPVTLFIKNNEIMEKYVGSINEADLYNKIEKHK